MRTAGEKDKIDIAEIVKNIDEVRASDIFFRIKFDPEIFYNSCRRYMGGKNEQIFVIFDPPIILKSV